MQNQYHAVKPSGMPYGYRQEPSVLTDGFAEHSWMKWEME